MQQDKPITGTPPIAIIVHGGAWDIPLEYREPHRVGCVAAAEAGWQVLVEGGTAMDAVEVAIRLLEDELDIQIFERSGKKLTAVSPAGHAILDHVTDLLNNVKK